MISVRNIALAAGFTVVVVVRLLAAAPVARADCYPWQGCWGAIAFSPSVRDYIVTTNRSSESRAVNDAVTDCNIETRAWDCVVVISGTACLAIATNPDTRGYNGGAGLDQAAADSAALSGVPGGSILGHDCNS